MIHKALLFAITLALPLDKRDIKLLAESDYTYALTKKMLEGSDAFGKGLKGF